MKPFYLPATEIKHPLHHYIFSKNIFFLFALALMATALPSSLSAQRITIYPRSNLVMNGNVSLVVNNAAFQNNGAFSAGNSTVNFSGYTDTLVSYVSGANSTTFNNLSITKSAYGVALKSAVAVTNVLAVNAGNLYTDSNLTLRSTASLTARVDVVPSGSNIFGKAMVERYFPARRAWRLLTAPVTSSNTIFNSWQNGGVYTTGLGMLVTGPSPTGAAGNGLDVSGYNNASMLSYNGSTQKLENVLNSKVPVSAGIAGSADNTGYFVFVRGDRNPGNTNVNNVNITTLTSIGKLQTGTQTFPASTVLGNFTLIGNPYASPYNFDNVTRTNLIKRFYAWDPTLNKVGGYVMLDDLGNTGTYTKTVSGSLQTKDIQSGQAFFVVTSSNGAASITFNETGKSGNNNNSMFRPLSPNTPTGVGTGELMATLNLLNPDNTTIIADGAFAQFDNGFSLGVNLDDATKFTNSNENLSIVRNNVLLSAERRPALGFNDTVYFRLTATSQRSYQFVFDAIGLKQPGMEGYLEDSYTGTSTLVKLAGATTINFAINADATSADNNRFKIVFKPSASTLPVTISSVKAYQKEKNIAVEWKVENELNMVKYEVEKSTDGTTFAPVNTTAVTGANNAYNTYIWIDVHPEQGNNFYRIKSYSRSGEVTYSSIVKVAMEKSAGSFSIYPNPVTGNVINLLMNNQPAGMYRVKLTNANGQVIFLKSLQNNGGNSAQPLGTGSKLPTGVYQLEITGQDNNHSVQRVVVD